ncbi:MAG: DUF3300 domain-containing protein [Phycisphaerales bacterium]|nr:DUF3300 domain-containing protein [Phycisphaerales bacterium]
MKTAWKTCVWIAAGWLAGGAVFAQGGAAPQQPAPAAVSPGAAAPAADQPAFKPEELEQMLAPIALYPDSLLSQIFMASTYPIEVVEADRWATANAKLQGDALAKELEKQSWDPSVRSLVNFPDILSMMSQNLSTTVKIGDAFIGQQKEVMAAVQKLRAKAKSTGNLESTDQQKVSTVTQEGAQVIVVESSSPEVIYVPQYNPTVVYGTWPYPAYPPYPYYPPGYVASNVISFGVGVACGAAWGYAWGNCNWGGGDVDIDINRNTNINNNIDRSKFKGAQGGAWKHDPGHRQGAAYRNQASAQRVGAGTTSARTTQARSEYRGKAEAGRTDIARGGADAARGGNPAARTGQAAQRGAGTAQNRPATTSGSRGGALNDASRGGNSARQASNRGATSRSASPSTRSSPQRSSGGARSSGGSRGGGGRGGGRR